MEKQPNPRIVRHTLTEIEFEWITDFFPDLQEVYRKQKVLGYNPAVFGCYRVQRIVSDNKMKVNWRCSAKKT